MSALGDRLAEGRTSEIFAYGRREAVKVPRRGVPPHWPRTEAAIAAAVHRTGLPCPEVKGLVEIDGRESIVFQRVDGPSMWEVIRQRPAEVERCADLLVQVQRSIHRAVLSPDDRSGLPSIVDRTVSKILVTDGLTERERHDAHRLVTSLPAGLELCHGDLHPGNVLMSPDGPMIIDWFDAAIGPPAADVARSSLLVRPASSGRIPPPHLPGASDQLLATFHSRYVERAVCNDAGLVDRGDVAVLLGWERALAAGRLAEHTTADRADLLAVWRSSTDTDADRSMMATTLAGLGLAPGQQCQERHVDPRR